MQGSRSKISSKILVRQHCEKGFNFGIKGLRKAKYKAIKKVMKLTKLSTFRT
jgi:hypothetical protein